MSKTLRTAAIVVGAVALVATGVGAAVGASAALAAGSAGIGSLSIAGLAAGAGALSAGLSFAASLTAKRPTVSLGGDQTAFTANANQGLPYPMGKTTTPGFIKLREASP